MKNTAAARKPMSSSAGILVSAIICNKKVGIRTRASPGEPGSRLRLKVSPDENN